MNKSTHPRMHRHIAPILATTMTTALTYLLLMPVTVHAAVPGHSDWEQFLQEHVQAGRVDYGSVHRDPGELQPYLDSLAKTRRGEFYAASDKTRLAFWINTYNAFTIRLIADHYPIASIWDVTPVWKRPLGGPFAEKFIPLGHLFPDRPLQRKLSLNDIEHEILRKTFNAPRVHFTLVCASTSCPSLNNHAYRADRLEEQFARATREFLADPSKNRYDTDTDTLYLSPIFSWFREDFERHGSLVGFIQPYLNVATTERLSMTKHAPRVEFNGYDWSLNDQQNRAESTASTNADKPGPCC